MFAPFALRRTRRRPAITITPLIDVMFLLLIFFMVSSTFRDQYGIDVDLPEAASAQAENPAPHEVTVTENGVFFFDGQEMDAARLRQTLEERVREDPEAQVVLRCDAGADFRHAITAIDAARQAGCRRLVVPTRFEDALSR